MLFTCPRSKEFINDVRQKTQAVPLEERRVIIQSLPYKLRSLAEILSKDRLMVILHGEVDESLFVLRCSVILAEFIQQNGGR